MKLRVTNLSKNFGKLEVLRCISFEVSEGESIALLGPSGCGKTTILRIVAGLEHETRGYVERNFSRLAYVFQEPRLIPWKTVRENLRFVVEDDEKITKILSVLRLSGFEEFKPAKLSGGMRQRVNLARAFLVEPDLILMDEPFSSLDLHTKLSIIQDVNKRREEVSFSMVLVTHDIREALLLADRIILLTDKPCVVRKEYDVTNVPKDIFDPRFTEVERLILADITNAP
ncbi:ABC transporter ATP-binding protein [Fervidobacterium thailandense]|uniref:ABC transporter ATP-binding protein n=1 Tax=Fervidobacterium thailandense TaxID=1008305 RepID=A0A1E3G2J9_9BACT|nr:ABC transporter ATP-binding protein [Fervidobacterium thailandense]ODN30514.1 ABC transporter ATP-binding protein [Fervidobacterium thailandense]